MDATVMSTGKVVMLKKIIKERHPYEVEIHRFLSTEPLASHPKNHCVPLLDVLEPPDDPSISLIVIPLLRPFGEPFFQTVGEMVEYFRQIFEVSHVNCFCFIVSVVFKRCSGHSIYAPMPHRSSVNTGFLLPDRIIYSFQLSSVTAIQ